MATRVTSADVGREAGVSRATVSYVLNNRTDARVTQATREHVLATAQRLGYHGSPAARALRAGRGEIVMLLLPDWNTAGELGRALGEIGRYAASLGLVCLRYEGPEWRRRLAHLLGMVSAAAVVTFDPLDAEDQEALAGAGVPEVRAWFLDSLAHAHTTEIDQASIVRAQIDHLLECGRQELAFVAAEAALEQDFARARLDAFRTICRERDLIADRIVFVADDPTELAGYLHTWHADASALGVVAFSDITAVGVLTAATIAALRVPEDVAVIGVDNSLIAPLTHPPLTSVRLDLTAEAATVAQKLATALDLPLPADGTHGDPLKVIARAST